MRRPIAPLMTNVARQKANDLILLSLMLAQELLT